MSLTLHLIRVFIAFIEILTSHLSAYEDIQETGDNREESRRSLADLLTEGLGLGSADSSGRTFGKIMLEHLWPRDPES